MKDKEKEVQGPSTTELLFHFKPHTLTVVFFFILFLGYEAFFRVPSENDVIVYEFKYFGNNYFFLIR